MSSSRAPRSMILGATLGAGIATPAAAQTPAVTAEALFVAGRDLLEAGQVAEACRKFEASHQIDPALGTMLHLGDCLEREGRTASAWAIFREAASVAGTSGQLARRDIAETRWRALEPGLARVVVAVPASHLVDGLVVEVAGVAVPPASWGVALPVDPGAVVVRASAPGRTPWAHTVAVDASHSARTHAIDVPLLAPARPPATTRPPAAARPSPSATAAQPYAATPRAVDDEEGSAWRTVGIVTGGAGLAALAVGTVFGVQAMTNNDASLERCRPDDPSLCSEDGVALRDSAESRAAVSTGFFVVGTALLGAGAALVLFAPDDDTGGARVGRIATRIAPDGAAIVVGGAL